MKITEKVFLSILTVAGVTGSGYATHVAIKPKTVFSKLVAKGFYPLNITKNSNLDKDKWVKLEMEYERRRISEGIPYIMKLYGSTDSLKAENLKNHCREIFGIQISKDSHDKFFEAAKKWCTRDSYFLKNFNQM